MHTPEPAPQAPGVADAPSLVLCSKTVDDTLRRCPRRGSTVLFDANDPTRWILSGCDAYACRWCGPMKARGVALGVAWELRRHDRSRFVTFTNMPPDWQVRRQRMRDLARWARKEGYENEWAWTTEEGSKTGMVHVHACQWGDYIPQADLQDRTGAIVDIRVIKGDAAAVTAYTAKGAGAVTRYLTKSAQDDYGRWLDLNGGRPLHTSRGFFQGVGTRGAVAAAKAEARKGDPVQWVVASAVAADVYLQSEQVPQDARVGFLRDRLFLLQERP